MDGPWSAQASPANDRAALAGGVMKWTRLFPVRLRYARMVAVSEATIHSKEAGPMTQQMSVLGIDIAKLVFHVVGMDDTGHVVLRKRLARSELLPFIAKLPPLRIGMEACGSAHYWARCFREHGHDVKLMAPHFVKPSVQSPQNDARDAEAICSAMTRPTMRFVPIKRAEQPDR